MPAANALKPPKLTELAARISAHLKRFEADPSINRVLEGRTIPPYYNAGAYQGGAYVCVRYVNFQGTTAMKRADAEAYLAWLDAGNIGTHYQMPREVKRDARKAD